VEGLTKVSRVLFQYYKGLLEARETQRTPIDPHVMAMGAARTIEQQLLMCKPFTDSDIKRMLFSIPNHKSLGPDGFNSGFYKAC